MTSTARATSSGAFVGPVGKTTWPAACLGPGSQELAQEVLARLGRRPCAQFAAHAGKAEGAGQTAGF